MQFKNLFIFLLLTLLLISCSNRKQLQYKTIKSKLQSNGDTLIHFKKDNYIIALRLDDLMDRYNTGYQSQVKELLIARDSMAFYPTSVLVDSIADFNHSAKDLNIQVKALIDNKQFTAYDLQTKKYIPKVELEIDRRLYNVVGIIWRYKDPNNDQVVFRYTDVFIGTPAF